MPRLARLVAPGLPHDVTQRGNRRQTTFFRDGDYRLYIALLKEWAGKAAPPSVKLRGHYTQFRFQPAASRQTGNSAVAAYGRRTGLLPDCRSQGQWE